MILHKRHTMESWSDADDVAVYSARENNTFYDANHRRHLHTNKLSYILSV